jgi:hypothetical protein
VFFGAQFSKKFAQFVVLWDAVSFGLIGWNLARAAREIQGNQLECGPRNQGLEIGI